MLEKTAHDYCPFSKDSVEKKTLVRFIMTATQCIKCYTDQFPVNSLNKVIQKLQSKFYIIMQFN